MWQRWLGCAAFAAVFLTVPAGTAAALEVQRFTIDEGTFVEPFAAGEGPCVPYAGALTEDRIMTGTQRIFDSGANAGTFQVVFTVDAAVTIAPDDPGAGPRYVGRYVERGTATGVRVVDGEDVPRTAHFQLRTRLSGSDGSVIHLPAQRGVRARARRRGAGRPRQARLPPDPMRRTTCPLSVIHCRESAGRPSQVPRHPGCVSPPPRRRAIRP